MLRDYLKKIADTTAQGDAREESYYTLLTEIGEQNTELHLLKSKSLNKPVVKYKGKGDDFKNYFSATRKQHPFNGG